MNTNTNAIESGVVDRLRAKSVLELSPRMEEFERLGFEHSNPSAVSALRSVGALWEMAVFLGNDGYRSNKSRHAHENTGLHTLYSYALAKHLVCPGFKQNMRFAADWLTRRLNVLFPFSSKPSKRQNNLINPLQLELWQGVTTWDGYVIKFKPDKADGVTSLMVDVGMMLALFSSWEKWAGDQTAFRILTNTLVGEPSTKSPYLPVPKPNFFFWDSESLIIYELKGSGGVRDEWFDRYDPKVRDVLLGAKYEVQEATGPLGRLVLSTNHLGCELSGCACNSDLLPNDVGVLTNALAESNSRVIAVAAHVNLSGRLNVGGVPIVSAVFRPQGIYTGGNCPWCNQSK